MLFRSVGVSQSRYDADTLQTLNNAITSQYRIINNNWTNTETKFSDISGKATFLYTPNIRYQFTISLNGYNSQTIDINPILSTDYTIKLTRANNLNTVGPTHISSTATTQKEQKTTP